MSACCCHQGERKPMSLLRRSGEVAAWAIPAAILALMPKCPVCLAAYVALWTGIGLTLSTATFLRTALVALCAVSLLFLIAKMLGAQYWRTWLAQLMAKSDWKLLRTAGCNKIASEK